MAQAPHVLLSQLAGMRSASLKTLCHLQRVLSQDHGADDQNKHINSVARRWAEGLAQGAACS